MPTDLDPMPNDYFRIAEAIAYLDRHPQADLDQVRNQLKTPEWSRIVGVKSAEDNENIEVHVRTENGKVTGVAILATDKRNFTVANIVGNVDLESLAAIGGQFGLPKLRSVPRPAPKKKEP